MLHFEFVVLGTVVSRPEAAAYNYFLTLRFLTLFFDVFEISDV